LRAREAELQKAGVPAGRVPAADCPFPAAAQVQLGQTLLAAGRFAEAEPPLREVLTFMDRAQTESWDRFAAKSMLGEAIAGQKKYADAEPLLLDGHRGLSDRAKAIPKTSAQAVPRARERLVQLYEAWGRPADAEKWRADRGKK
jgi:predicted Zn-dependent protease